MLCTCKIGAKEKQKFVFVNIAKAHKKRIV